MNGSGDMDYSIKSSGDTVIQGETYIKLITPFVNDNSFGNCGNVGVGYKGAYREDVSNQKVYYVPPFTSTEQLLYDFTMQPGDTVQGYLTDASGFDPNVVESIDSVVVGGAYRKQWIVNTGYNVRFIEGIGSTYGLIQPLPGEGVTDLPDYSLTCFAESGMALYPDMVNCQVISHVTKALEALNLNIYPNPTTSTINIQLPKKNHKATRTRIYDMTGRLVHQQPFNPNMDVSHLDRGTYIVVVETEEGNFRGTVQKQ